MKDNCKVVVKIKYQVHVTLIKLDGSEPEVWTKTFDKVEDAEVAAEAFARKLKPVDLV